MLTIKGKIILANLLVFGLMLVGFAITIYRSTRESELAKLDARLQVCASKLQRELEDEPDNEESSGTHELFTLVANTFPEVKFRILDRWGHVVIEDSTLATYSSSSWQKALDGSSEKAMITLNRQRYRYLLIPVEIDDRIKFVLQLAAPMTGVQASMRRLITLFSIAIPTALLLTALVGCNINSGYCSCSIY